MDSDRDQESDGAQTTANNEVRVMSLLGGGHGHHEISIASVLGLLVVGTNEIHIAASLSSLVISNNEVSVASSLVWEVVDISILGH